MAGGHVDAYKLRYIVPFYFAMEGGQTFDTICARITASADWEVKDVRELAKEGSNRKQNPQDEDEPKMEGTNEIDQDLYAYITDLYKQHPYETNSENRKNNIACAWDYAAQGKLPVIFGLKREEHVDKFKIGKAGLFLYRSGIGLLWYEIELFKRNNNNPPTVSELICFQNRLKELNQKKKKEEWIEFRENTIKDPDKGKLKKSADVTESDEYLQFDTFKTTSVRENNREWTQNIKIENIWVERGYIEGLDDSLRDSAFTFTEMKAYYNRNKDCWTIKWNAQCQFNMGEWIVRLLDPVIPYTELHFLPEKRNYLYGDGKPGHYKWVPDKAILFNYVFVDYENAGKDYLQTIAYYLTNGYPETYQIPRRVEQMMQFPYGNICWYTSIEGFGYYVRKQDVPHSKIKSYQNDFLTGIIAGYFLLFIHLLYQRYTLIYFAERIEENLSADSDDYKLKSEADDEITKLYSQRCIEQLEDIRMDINVFLIKSVNASVSHAGYQNEFYDYSEKRLGIRDNIESVTSGLQSLEELQQIRLDRKMQVVEEKRQKENEKITNTVGMLSILAVVSAYADGFSTIEVLKGLCMSGWDWSLEKIGQVGIFTGITILAAYVIWTCFVSRWIKRRSCRLSKKKK